MPYIIAINGPSCAGKSYISNILKNISPNRISILSYDSYCVDRGVRSQEEIKKINYDVPTAYDAELLIEHVKALKNNKSIECPVYDFTNHRRTNETIHFEPNDIIIIEGIMVFQVGQLMDGGYDLKVAVTANEKVRYKRRFKRDQEERGRTPASIKYQWKTTVLPSSKLYIEPYALLADIVLNNDKNNKDIENIEVLENKIREILGL